MATKKTSIYHFLIFVALTIEPIHMKTCGVINSTPGYTEPAGDIYIRHGEDLKLTCIIDLTLAQGLNSNNLIFKVGNKDVLENVTRVINETAIELYIERPKPSSNMYYCFLRNPANNNGLDSDQSVCLNMVTIGIPPQNPDDFHCVSNNWENLTCKFHRKNNYVKTDYDISFYLPTTRMKFKNNCTNRTDDVMERTTTCFWNHETKVIYRQQYDEYVFLIKMSNMFGNQTFTYNFSHFENIIPAQPSFIDIQEKGTHSALLIWNVSRPMNTFKPGLHHRIKYISQYKNTTWKEANTSAIPIEPNLQYHFELKDLEFANTLYDVRVQIKAAPAPDKEEKWSKYKAITFKTLPELPARPPKTAVGSFEIVDKGPTRDVLVFWQKIEDHERNGPEFKYEINMTENGNVVKLADRLENRFYYANFSDLSYKKEYLFTIASTNSIGRSVNQTYIRVPRREQTLFTKLAFTKILLSDFIYELSWRKPANIDIRNFTVFWCQSVRERPSICPNSLEWKTVSGNTTSLKVTVASKSNHQFAIAANTDDMSSGMIWATCTVNIKGVGKLRTVRIESVGDTFIKVSWVLECSVQIGVVTGYRIHYCIMNTPHISGCQGPKQTMDVTDLDDFAVIGNLKPYTTYQINVSVITQNKEGLPSDPLYNTTLEAAPTKPLNVKPVEVTNSTISVKWDQPAELNGFIKYYEIDYSRGYDTKTEKVEKDMNRTVLLTNLHGYTDYKITVRACTLKCSKDSDPIVIRTKITYPSNVKDPFFNTSTWLISWQRPDYPGGEIDYYEVLLKITKNKISEEHLRNVTKNNYTVPNSICEPKTETEFTVLVRAVNRVPIETTNGATSYTTYPGSWSKEVPYRCPGDPNNVQPFIWSGGIIAGLLIFGLIAFACKRIKDYIEGIKDIEVKLPPGISSSIEKDARFPFDETSLLPHNHGKLSSGERNTIDSSFTSKAISNESGLHNKSDEISGNKWSDSNNDKMDLLNTGNKLTKLSNAAEDKWLTDKIEGYTKFTTDNYPDNSTKYCLVGAEEPSKNNGKTPSGYVQAVLPAHSQVHKPYESFECTILKPLVNKNQTTESALSYTPMPQVVEKSSGYLPISSLPEQPTRLLLSPSTPEDSPDDEEFMSQIKPEIKRPNTSSGYVVVDTSNVGNKFHTPLIPINVPNLQNSAIPKGYVKAAEVPGNILDVENTSFNNKPNPGNILDVENTSFNNKPDHATSSSHAQVHSPYVAHSEINKCLNPDITNKVLSSNVNPSPPISSGYVQHRIEHN